MIMIAIFGGISFVHDLECFQELHPPYWKQDVNRVIRYCLRTILIYNVWKVIPFLGFIQLLSLYVII